VTCNWEGTKPSLGRKDGGGDKDFGQGGVDVNTFVIWDATREGGGPWGKVQRKSFSRSEGVPMWVGNLKRKERNIEGTVGNAHKREGERLQTHELRTGRLGYPVLCQKEAARQGKEELRGMGGGKSFQKKKKGRKPAGGPGDPWFLGRGEE